MGVYTASNGVSFRGIWHEDQLNGKSIDDLDEEAVASVRKTNTMSQEKYVGQKNWLGQYHGHWVKIWANGDKYDGEWKNGKKEGHGVLTWANGDKYEGDWKNGKKE